MRRGPPPGGPEMDGRAIGTHCGATARVFVTMEADRPGRVSDNGVPVFPGAPVVFTFTPAVPGGTVQLAGREPHASFT